jgi:hypothetical protein
MVRNISKKSTFHTLKRAYSEKINSIGKNVFHLLEKITISVETRLLIPEKMMMLTPRT